MKLSCLIHGRRLSERAAAGMELSPSDPLYGHLENCKHCTELAQELAATADRIRTLRSNVIAAPGFQDRVWADIQTRLTANRRQGRGRNVAVALAAASCVLAVIALWPRGNRTDATPQRVAFMNEASVGASRVVGNVDVESVGTHRKTPAAVSIPKIDTSVNRRLASIPAHGVRNSSNPRRPRRALKPTVGQSLAGTRSAKSPATSTTGSRIQWAAWGAWYESVGDYQTAMDAYGRALDERPDTGIALRAGQAAEQAGNLQQAVDYLSQALTDDSNPPSIQKGTSLWNSDHISA